MREQNHTLEYAFRNMYADWAYNKDGRFEKNQRQRTNKTLFEGIYNSDKLRTKRQKERRNGVREIDTEKKDPLRRGL